MAGWIKKDSIDPEKRVLVWHQYQGAIVYNGGDALKNRFITHYMPLEEVAWEYKRKPEKEDEDHTGCILVIDTHGTVCTRNRRYLETMEETVRAWARLPDRPDK